MSIEDRDWYKDDFDRRMGRGKHKPKSPEKAKPESAREEAKPNQKERTGRFERVKKRQPTEEEKRTYNNAPPAHTILAAKYELAIRARTKKTFWAGFALGAVAASAATYTIIPLLSIAI